MATVVSTRFQVLPSTMAEGRWAVADNTASEPEDILCDLCLKEDALLIARLLNATEPK